VLTDPAQLLDEAILVGTEPVQVGTPAHGVPGEVDSLLDLLLPGAEELGDRGAFAEHTRDRSYRTTRP